MIHKKHIIFAFIISLFISNNIAYTINNDPADIHAFWGDEIMSKALEFRSQLSEKDQAIFDTIPEKCIAVTQATQSYKPLLKLMDEIKAKMEEKNKQYAAILPLIKKFLQQASNITITINPETMTIGLMDETGEEISNESIESFSKILSKKNQSVVKKIISDIQDLNTTYQPRITTIIEQLTTIAEKLFTAEDERIFEQFKIFIQE